MDEEGGAVMGLISLPEMRREYVKSAERVAELRVQVAATTSEVERLKEQGSAAADDLRRAQSRLTGQQREYGEQFRRMDCLRFGIQDYYALAACGVGPAVDWRIVGIEGSHVRIDTELSRIELRCISGDLLDGDNVEHEKAGPGGWYIVARYPCGHATRWQYRTGEYVAARLRQLTQEVG